MMMAILMIAPIPTLLFMLRTTNTMTSPTKLAQHKDQEAHRGKGSPLVVVRSPRVLDPGVSDLSPQRGPSRVQRPQRGAKDRVTSPLRGATLLEVVLPEDIHREEEDKPWVGFFVMIIYCSCHLSYIV